MSKVLLIRLVMIIALIITVYACKPSTEDDKKTGDDKKDSDTSGMVRTVRFKPTSNGYYRQKCLYVVSKALVDSVKASSGYRGQDFSISQTFEPTGDTLTCRIILNIKGLPGFTFSYRDSIPIVGPVGPGPVRKIMSDTIPVGEPAGPPPGLTSLYIFCVQPGDMPCQ